MTTRASGATGSDDELPFHRRIRLSTLEAHDRANGSAYMAALFDGRLDLEDYVRLLEQYAFVYGAIEDVADRMVDDPVAGDFVVDALRRRAAVEADLRHFGVTAPRALPAAQRYADRVRAAGDWSGGYVAHHYTRYLGDLAGGQAIGTLLRRRYGVVDGGTAFYDFSALGPTPEYRRRFRAQLDAAPWDAAERERVLAEVACAFELNIAMFVELADAAGVTPDDVPRSA